MGYDSSRYWYGSQVTVKGLRLQTALELLDELFKECSLLVSGRREAAETGGFHDSRGAAAVTDCSRQVLYVIRVDLWNRQPVVSTFLARH